MGLCSDALSPLGDTLRACRLSANNISIARAIKEVGVIKDVAAGALCHLHAVKSFGFSSLPLGQNFPMFSTSLQHRLSKLRVLSTHLDSVQVQHISLSSLFPSICSCPSLQGWLSCPWAELGACGPCTVPGVLLTYGMLSMQNGFLRNKGF